ncbi:MAG: diaminopimelate decarboxylase [Phycisphaeraceae bacterium]|nr:MAG: diaminopimelate decarboxylase [Phycisphaeraceae bacterium]
MDHFEYRDGELWAEGVRLADVAQSVGTPLYVYASATLALHLARLTDAFAPLRARVHFAVKSLPNTEVLRLLGSLGSGMDVVSGGELERVRRAGVPMDRVSFAGVGKSEAEIARAIALGVGWINAESEHEVRMIAQLAESAGRRPSVCLRVNPGIDARTHAYITTGTRANKFGVGFDAARAVFDRFARDPRLRLRGLHVHVGSLVGDPSVHTEAVAKILSLADDLDAAGHPIDTLNLGGGFGADYRTGQTPSAAAYAAAVVPLLKDRAARGTTIIIEPGRFIAANAGVLLTRVRDLKPGDAGRTFAVCDAGMITLLRPALYGAFHFVWPVSPAGGLVPKRREPEPPLEGLSLYDVVGPVCESGDFLAQGRPLPTLERGDLLAVFASGAYGMSMASTYNDQPRPAEVLVDGDARRVVRRRETTDDLFRFDTGLGDPA